MDMHESGRVFLSASQVLAHKGKRTTEDVHVPEWGGWVCVSSMAGVDRDAFEQSMLEEKTGPGGKTQRVQNYNNFRAKLLASTLVDQNGARMFTEDQARELGQLDALAMERCVEVAQRLNGFSKKDVDELVGNSETAPGDDSSSI